MASDNLNKMLDTLDRLEVEQAAPLDAVADALSDFGLTGIVMFRRAAQAGQAPSVMFSNLPDEWRLRYRHAGYDRIDPLTPAALSATRAFTWDELPADMFAGPATTMFNEAAAFSLRKGFCVPVRTAAGAGAVSMAGEAPSLDRPVRRLIELMVTRAFDQTARVGVGRDTRLSARETDVLSWIAAGKTADEAGRILGISSLTVSEHLKRIRRKLQTSNTPHTVVTAMRLGLLSL